MANFNFNKVILGGRIASDVELKTTPSGVSVTSFSLAVNRRHSGKGEEPQTDFINVTAWRGTAEFLAKYFRKASSVAIVGRIETRSWTDQNGEKRYATGVVADEVYFVDSKSEGKAESAPATSYMPTSYMPDADKLVGDPHLQTIVDDDDLPF